MIKWQLFRTSRKLKPKIVKLFVKGCSFPPLSLYFTSVVCGAQFLVGIGFGFSSQVIPFLESTGDLNANKEELYWIATTGMIFRPIGAILDLLLIDRLGRHFMLRVLFSVSALGWLIITFSPNEIILCIGRAISSLGVGMMAAPLIYIAEMSEPKHRATLLQVSGTMLLTGTEVIYILNAIFYWKVASGIITCYCFICLLLLPTIPESFYWYVGKNRISEAKASYKWAKNCNDETAEQKIRKMQEGNITTHSNYFTSFYEDMKCAEVYKPLLILLAIHFLRLGLGFEILQGYAVKIFSELKTPYDSESISIIFGFLSIVLAAISCSIVYLYDKRSVYFSTCCVILVFISVVIIIELIGGDPYVPFPFLTMVSFLTYNLVCTSVQQISFGVIAEILPSRCKGNMFGVVTLFVFAMAALYIQLYGEFGIHVPITWFLFFSMINCLLLLIVVYLFLPETRNKSLDEIERHFKNKSFDIRMENIEFQINSVTSKD